LIVFGGGGVLRWGRVQQQLVCLIGTLGKGVNPTIGGENCYTWEKGTCGGGEGGKKRVKVKMKEKRV